MIQILTHIAAFVLGGITIFVLFVYAAWSQRKAQKSPTTINESRPIKENVVAVLNPIQDVI